MVIRTGILVDSLIFKKWQEEIVSFILNDPGIELNLFIVGKEAPAKKDKKGKFFNYRVLRFIDRKIFSFKNDSFATNNLSYLSTKIDKIEAAGTSGKFTFEFSDDDVMKIDSYDLDVLIRFGFGIIKGSILRSARFGVWSLHHGDNSVNRGGPPGFWEVVNGEAVTGVTLQKLSPDLDGGEVIRKSFITTNRTSFNRNQNNIFWAGVELFTSALKDLSLGKLEVAPVESYSEKPKSNFVSGFYSYPLYKDPENKKAFAIFLSFWRRRLKEIFQEKMAPPNWALYYNYSKSEGIEKALFRYKKLNPPRGYDWADPFVIKHAGEYFLFFEELKINGKGHISLLIFDQAGKLKSPNPQIVLKENWHLSYPFIFAENSFFYMLPEAAESGEVWIYESLEFPARWEKKFKIMDNKALYDPTLLFKDNMWYLFATEKINVGSSTDQYLHIYYSKELFGNNWLPHAENPVTRDDRGSRPAGKIFEQEGKLIRPAQLGAPNYGYGIQFKEITELSPLKYSEKEIDTILPKFRNGIIATHTFNFDGIFAVVDAQGTYE